MFIGYHLQLQLQLNF